MRKFSVLFFIIAISPLAIGCFSQEERVEDCIARKDREQCLEKFFNSYPANLQQKYHLNDDKKIKELCSELSKTNDEVLRLNLLQVVFANDPSCACKYLNEIKETDENFFNENKIPYEGYCNDEYMKYFYGNREQKTDHSCPNN